MIALIAMRPRIRPHAVFDPRVGMRGRGRGDEVLRVLVVTAWIL
jgi:hypothetical protein